MGKEKKDLEFDGEIALFEEKPFSGFCFDYVDPIGEQHHPDLAITEMFGGLPEEFYSSYTVRSTLDVFGSEGYYKNGKKDGLWTYWYPEGQKSSEAHYKDGVENGVTTRWYQNSQQLSEKHYKDGVEDGVTTYWNPNGQFSSKAHYKEGTKLRCNR